MEVLGLKETYLRARIRREDASSTRFSKSFRSNNIISSIASSPGYALNEEIDPSTYSFTKALEALQAKNIHSWDDMSAERVALNSKWCEAERYICNPLSGEVPVECLSARTLSGRSFSQSSRGIAVSTPLVYPLHLRQLQIRPSLIATPQDQLRLQIQQEAKTGNVKRVVESQSASSVKNDPGSPSPTTPSVEERPIRRNEEDTEEESPLSVKNVRLQEEEKWNETSEEVEGILKYEQGKKKSSNNEKHIMCRWSRRQGGGLLPCWNLWMKRNHQDSKHRSRKKMIFFCHNIFC